ncbi:hypothetical protein FNF29_02590 [Cafeteria roenbergensis]|uniref:Bacterial bifunctional deaminase-reductase C-terminal domain-containing protein n=1 Tax=Cafeteria roenbergensis TaxID=33653 RepID=A0A5A8CQ94_CAFRO|nr:hypothetical protein FNF29_02590 [Cafeteria roenbergensis]|eukprot:KAA0154370.1 hypothetical protein FNF29_02590 [Cafeteria roenbergensis]
MALAASDDAQLQCVSDLAFTWGFRSTARFATAQRRALERAEDPFWVVKQPLCSEGTPVYLWYKLSPGRSSAIASLKLATCDSSTEQGSRLLAKGYTAVEQPKGLSRSCVWVRRSASRPITDVQVSINAGQAKELRRRGFTAVQGHWSSEFIDAHTRLWLRRTSRTASREAVHDEMKRLRVQELEALQAYADDLEAVAETDAIEDEAEHSTQAQDSHTAPWPFICLSFAQSVDGSISDREGRMIALSCPAAMRMTHELRAAHDAIVVGVGTVKKDNPSLTVRLCDGRTPLPVVVDSELELPLDCKLLTSPSCRKPVVLCLPFDEGPPRNSCRGAEREGGISSDSTTSKPLSTDGEADQAPAIASPGASMAARAAALRSLGATVLQCADATPGARRPRLDLVRALRSLGPALGVRSVMVEVQAGWLPSEVRALLLALRPWSFPLSALPVAAVAVAASEAGLEGANLWRTAVLATAVVALHATANLVNTVVDFSKGVDQGAEADDRTLVDGLVSEGQLRAVAWLSALIGGAASSAFVAESLGVDMAGVLGSRPAAAGRGEEVALTLAAILASGLCLAVVYTAGPCGLKYRGLGELTVFACFGPLLGAAASLALTGTLSDDCLLASVPFGAVAVAVLHSNNVRDADADGRAGAFTLAQALGARLNALLYTLALWTAAGAAVLACASAAARRAGLADAGVPPRFGSASLHAASRCLTGQSPCPGFWPQAAHGLMLLAMCAPWAVSLTSRLSRGSLRFLPQLTAQWGTLLGGALLAGIAAPAAAGRGLLAVLFMLGGVNNVVMWTHSAALVTAKMREATGLALPGWLCRACAAAATAVQIGAGAAFSLGVQACASAALLLVFLAAVTPVVHDMWSYGLPPGDPATPAGRAAKAESDSDSAEAAEPAAAGGDSDGQEVFLVRYRRSSSSGRRRRRNHNAAPIPPGPAAPEGNPFASALPAGAGGVPTFLDPFASEFVHFFKNVGMAGGLLVFLAYSGDCTVA